MTETNRSARALPVLLGLGGVWGASFLFIKVIVDETGPLELLAGRLFFGSVALGLFMVYRRLSVPMEPLFILQVSLLALVTNVVPFGLIAWGEEHIPSGTASVLNSTVPIFTAVFAAVVLAEEGFTPARALGLLLGFAGIVVLTGDDVVRITDSDVLGQLAVVGAAACYGIGAVISRALLRTRDAMSLSIVQLVMGTVITVPVIFAVSGTPDYGLSLEAYGSLLALGVFGTGLGIVTYLWLIDNIGSVRASLVTYIVPVIALLLGWLVLDEEMGANVLLGAFLIVAGVASVMRGQAPVSERVAALAPAVE